MAQRVVLLGAGNTIAIVAGAEDSNGAFALLDYELAPGFAALPPHVHQREDTVLYVLEGRLLVQVGRTDRMMEPGEFIFLPRDIVHGQVNPGTRPVRFLTLLVPAGFERCYPALESLLERKVPSLAQTLTALLASYGVRAEGDGVPFGGIDTLVSHESAMGIETRCLVETVKLQCGRMSGPK